MRRVEIDPLTTHQMPDIHKIMNAMGLVRLGRDQACKDIWDAMKKKAFVSKYGAVIKLEDLYRELFKEAI